MSRLYCKVGNNAHSQAETGVRTPLQSPTNYHTLRHLCTGQWGMWITLQGGEGDRANNGGGSSIPHKIGK